MERPPRTGRPGRGPHAALRVVRPHHQGPVGRRRTLLRLTALSLVLASALALSRAQERHFTEQPWWREFGASLGQLAKDARDIGREPGWTPESIAAVEERFDRLEGWLEDLVEEGTVGRPGEQNARFQLHWTHYLRMQNVLPTEDKLVLLTGTAESARDAGGLESNEAQALALAFGFLASMERYEEIRHRLSEHPTLGRAPAGSPPRDERIDRATIAVLAALAEERLQSWSTAGRYVALAADMLAGVDPSKLPAGSRLLNYADVRALLPQVRFRLGVAQIRIAEAILAARELGGTVDLLEELFDSLAPDSTLRVHARARLEDARGRSAVAQVQLPGLMRGPKDVLAVVEKQREPESWQGLPLGSRAEILHLQAMFSGMQAELDPAGSPELVDDWRAAVEELLALEGVSPTDRRIHLRRAVEYGCRIGALPDALRYADRLEDEARADAGGVRLADDDRLGLTAIEIAFARRGARGATREDLRNALAAAEDALADRIAAARTSPVSLEGTVPLWFAGSRFLFSERIEGHMQLEPGPAGQIAALEVLLQASELGAVTRRRGVRASRVADVRALLEDEGHGILMPFRLLDEGYTFALDRETLTVARTTGLDALGATARGLAKSLAVPAAEREEGELERLLQQLSQILLPPAILDHIGTWERLTVVGEDNLKAVFPFDLLPTADGSPLWEHCKIDHVASTHLLQLLSSSWDAKAGRARTGSLVLSGPTPSKQAEAEYLRRDKRLPITRSDVRARIPSGAALLWGSTATEERLWSSLARAPRVLQLLVHGVVDTRRRLPVGLVLTPGDDQDDGILWTDEVATRADAWIQAERVLPAFVALTACRSGAAQANPGEDGTGSLGGAWLWGGTQAVLEARQDLEVRFTLALSARLHELLQDPEARIADVLQTLRRECAAHETYSDPFYHGGLRAVGLGQRPLR